MKKEQRKWIKQIYDFNQYVKSIYDNYYIIEDGFVIGRPIKEKFSHAYYKTNILETHPELKNSHIIAEFLYDAFRDKHKPDEISIDGKITLIENQNFKKNIGNKLDENGVALVGNHVYKLVKKLGDVITNSEGELEFSDEEIKDLINYKVISPKFFGLDKFTMILTISEFPLVKKFKNVKAYMRDYDEEDFFDVVFVTYSDKGEKFSCMRRFLKL